jgi:ABC-2 type transport system ATP-binding protein
VADDPNIAAKEVAAGIKAKLRNYQLEAAIEDVLDFPRSFLPDRSPEYIKFRDHAILLADRYSRLGRQQSDNALDSDDDDEEQFILDVHSFTKRALDAIIFAENLRRASGVIRLSQRQAKVVISLKECRKQFGGFALGPITLDINEGDVLALMGPNASGKSTLLRIILRELSVSNGDVQYPGLPATWSYRGRRSTIGYVPQFPAAWHGPLRENLHYFLSARGVTGDENRKRVDYYLHRFHLEQYQDKNWDEISGGFKLRFVLARELLTEPRVLILDEPLAHLDVESQFDLLDIIKTISTRPKQPITVILTSQHIYETERFCSTAVVLREGKVVVQGPLSHINSIHRMSIFELETDSDSEPVIRFIRQINLRIRARPPIYLIMSDDPLDMDELITALASSKIRIKSIRDISSSSRFFFKDSEQAI